MRASALVLVLSFAVGAAGAPGQDPASSSPTCTTRVGTVGRACSNQRQEEQLQLLQHERDEQHERPSFAKGWVSRARGGGSKVPAGGGGGKKSGGKDKDPSGGGKAPDEVELALVGNFPNRYGCICRCRAGSY